MLEISYSGNTAMSEGCDASIGYHLYDSDGILMDGGEMDYDPEEFHGSDVAVIIPKVIDFCFNRKSIGYMLLAEDQKRSLYYMVMHGKTRYFENTSGLDVEALCSAYADCRLPFVEMARYGQEIGIEEYAGIEQGTNLSFSIAFDSDEDENVIFDGMKCTRRSMGELVRQIS